MKRDKLRIGVITAALAMMIAGGVLTWQQDARNGKADQAKQGETAQLTEDESTGTTEQQTEETAGDADGTRAVQDQADDVENSLEQVPEMEAACEEEAAGNPEADAETAQNTPEESDGNTERQDAQAVNGTAADQNGETGSGETAANEETSAASGTVDSAENQETAVETAGAAQDLMFSEATIMELPVTGTVLIPYNMENTVYFPTLDLYQCNPGVVFSAAEGTPVLAAADGEVYLFSTYNEQSPKLNILTNDGMNLTYDLSAVPANSSYGSIAVGTEYIYISVLQDGAVVTYSAPKDEPQNLTRLGDVTCRPAWNGSMQLINNMVYSAVVSSTDMPIDVKYHEALDDTLRLAKAKAIAESIVEGYRATNSSGKAELEYKIKAGLSESGYTNVTAEVNEFTVTPATASAEGSATGTITLVCGRKSDIVRINKTIAKLTETKILFLSDKEVRVSLNDTGEKYVIFAEYEGEKLKRTAIVPVTFNEPGEKTILLPSGWTKTTANALRAFFWNSLEDIRPLCGNAAR